ncbi:hypothetical protein BKA62DRAFT_684104 [Auriculariales sp. MPI-PUGE-AT-0066]|nr:hypothetical protein BKA62DRAFT_684104 [Auriculariales sp. MPI-PUGE-AT-0066]
MFALDRNRFAQPAEAAILRESVLRDNAHLVSLRARQQQIEMFGHKANHALLAAREAADSANMIVSRLVEQIEAVNHRMEFAMRLLHPLRRASEQVVQEIQLQWLLSTVAEESTSSADSELKDRADIIPFHAASVCRAWRSAALANKQLWSFPTIYFDSLRKTDSPLARLLAWKLRFDIHISRSSAGRMTVRFIGDTPASDVNCLADEISRLLAAAESVTINSCNYNDDPLDTWMQSSFPHLRDVLLTNDTADAEYLKLSEVFPHCTSLESLTLRDWTLDWDCQGFLSGLTTLQIFSDSSSINLSELTTISVHVPTLRNLTLEVVAIEGYEECDCLDCCGMEEHDHECCNSECELEEDDHECCVSNEHDHKCYVLVEHNHTILFNNLQTLRLHSSRESESISNWLRAPSLNHADITSSKELTSSELAALLKACCAGRPPMRTRDIASYFQSHATPHPPAGARLSSLKLSRVIVDFALGSDLFAAPFLQEIVLSDCLYASGQKGFALALSGEKANQSWITPRLTKLALLDIREAVDSHDGKIAGPQEVVERICAMASARCIASAQPNLVSVAQLEHLQLTWLRRAARPKGLDKKIELALAF